MNQLTFFDRDLIVNTWNRLDAEKEINYWKEKCLTYQKKYAGKFRKNKKTK